MPCGESDRDNAGARSAVLPDHAAGALIASEAGCFVTDIFGHALDFSKGRGLEKNKGIVCAPPRVHGQVLGAIKALGIGKAL